MNLAQLNLRRRSDERREQHANQLSGSGCAAVSHASSGYFTTPRTAAGVARRCRGRDTGSTMRADGPGRPRPPPASGSSGDSTCEVWRGPAGSSSAGRSVALIAADQGASPCLVRPHTDRYT